MDPDLIEKREDFRSNLTLGVVAALEKVPKIQDVVLAEHQPSDNIAITSWEQRYSTMLPHEIKDFYLANDGFKLTWNFKYAGELVPLGNMTINRIADLKRVAGIRHRFDTEQPTITDLEVNLCMVYLKRRRWAEFERFLDTASRCDQRSASTACRYDRVNKWS